jgi:hypothetical protein
LRSHSSLDAEGDRISSLGKFKYVKIEERPINPTIAQAFKSVYLCQMLSDLYRDIHLFRFDPLVVNIYILAQENIEIVIYPAGNWEFV